MPVRSCYIDVDNTLVDDNLTLYPNVKEKLTQWAEKYTLICWSHTGGDYAKKVCIKHGIDRYFKYFLDKPDIVVDDKPSLLLELPAKIVIGDPMADWAKPDAELFRDSRKEIK